MSWGYYRDLLRGVMDYAKARRPWDFRMAQPTLASAQSLLRGWRPDAALMPVPNAETAALLRRWGRPAVNVSYHVREARLPRVGAREDLIGEAAARHFLDKGYRTFAFVGHRGVPYSDERLAAYARALRAAGREVLFADDPGASLLTFLKGLPRPAAVFCATDGVSWSVAEVCASAGLRVPEDLALLGVDNDEFQCTLAHPPLSSIAGPGREIGYEAAGLLDRLLHGECAPKAPLLLAPKGVVTRQSTDVLAIEDPDLAAAVRFINERCDRPLAVKEILRAVPVSRRALEVKFRQTLGRSPLQEIQRVRIERARRLILETDLALGEIARRTGFGGLVQFSATFKKVTGQPASALRRPRHQAP
ncbi:MAG: XylR family transcriptional regulator [Planctomycetota bacterium]|nr:XylR family transcriptional regulator [Planctomycetota bacterium]